MAKLSYQIAYGNMSWTDCWRREGLERECSGSGSSPKLSGAWAKFALRQPRMLFQQLTVLVAMLRRACVQSSDQLRCRWRHRRLLTQDDVSRRYLFAIDPTIGVIIRSEGGTFQRNACKRAAGSRVGQHLGAEWHPSPQRRRVRRDRRPRMRHHLVSLCWKGFRWPRGRS